MLRDVLSDALLEIERAEVLCPNRSRDPLTTAKILRVKYVMRELLRDLDEPPSGDRIEQGEVQ